MGKMARAAQGSEPPAATEGVPPASPSTGAWARGERSPPPPALAATSPNRKWNGVLSTATSGSVGNLAIDAAVRNLLRSTAVLVPASLSRGAGIHAHAAADGRATLPCPIDNLNLWEGGDHQRIACAW